MSGFIIVADLSVEIVVTEVLMVDVECFIPEVVLGPEVLR